MYMSTLFIENIIDMYKHIDFDCKAIWNFSVTLKFVSADESESFIYSILECKILYLEVITFRCLILCFEIHIYIVIYSVHLLLPKGKKCFLYKKNNLVQLNLNDILETLMWDIIKLTHDLICFGKMMFSQNTCIWCFVLSHRNYDSVKNISRYHMPDVGPILLKKILWTFIFTYLNCIDMGPVLIDIDRISDKSGNITIFWLSWKLKYDYHSYSLLVVAASKKKSILYFFPKQFFA
ncbi:hypothetical protein KUTeg_020514 [Tegillarca granosa]|uniref:Uncharacterized protein n=1 Tax=Tegillarca granosa TaxID=220873 RepID=A0ABQ9ED82_TEGGR|nr:hypothetical protein KUTeg_020514 [Tegillarca granosa]